MSQGCSEYQQAHISQALWFLQTKGSAELQSMIIQPNGLRGVFDMTREEADRLLVPTVTLPIAKLLAIPKPRAGPAKWKPCCIDTWLHSSLYSQWRGNPSVCIFSVHIPKQYRQTHRFQLLLTGLPLPGLVPPQVGAPCTSLLKGESEWGCSFGNPDSFSKEDASRCTYAQIMPTGNHANPT